MEIEIKKDLLDINLSNSSPVVESLASQVVVGTIIVGTGSSIKGRWSKVNWGKGIPLFINQNQENLVSYMSFLSIKRLWQCD